MSRVVNENWEGVGWEKWFVRGFNLINPLKVLRKEGVHENERCKPLPFGEAYCVPNIRNYN